ncbi:MAG: 3-dehydroquinate synthase, partial [Oscillospiraceae bacterium]
KIVVPFGESSKSSEMLNFLYSEMLKFGITRSDIIVALGGGVVGDLAGFAAATLLRGIPCIQIPTTILSQVDSSVGGKVAINLPNGKNLVGAFHQPKLVIIDIECLNTLDERFISDGMAEVVKYGAISDENLFKTLENIKNKKELFANLSDIIYNCCMLKSGVVESDEFDVGNRMILNFGHTFGHAIEAKYNYEKYTHGEAVAIGMVMAAEYGESCGYTKSGTAKRIRGALANFSLPQDAAIENEDLLNSINVDKKGDGSFINLILLKNIGDVFIHKMEKDKFRIK